MISFGSVGRCFSVHVKEDRVRVAVFSLGWVESECEDRETAFVKKECKSEHTNKQTPFLIVASNNLTLRATANSSSIHKRK